MVLAHSRQSIREVIIHPRNNTLSLLGIAGMVALVHVFTNHLYGFHRDELQFLSDARHLDWGFVSYPPLTPLVERVSLEVFGLSMTGLRLASVLAQSLCIVVTGLMTRELSGGRLAQVAAALAVALSPISLFEGTQFQYTSFDYLWWVLAAYFVVCLLKSEDPRWWLAVGATAGLGFMTKYTIAVLMAGLVCGFLATPARRLLWNWWLLSALCTALLIVLPNLLWQANHGFISYDFLHSIHQRDMRLGRANGFVLKQFFVCTNFYATPLWISGVWLLLRSRRYRPLAWMYLVPLAFFYFAQWLFYYLAPAYPMLIAMGSAAGEQWVSRLSRLWERVVVIVFFIGTAGTGIYSAARILPLSSSGPLMHFALENNDALREEIDWNELVRTIAGIRDSLSPVQQASVGVLVGNYGEQGAVELLGPVYQLPMPISLTNSAWLRGYPPSPPLTLIVIGFSREAAERAFTSCRLAGHNRNDYGIQNEESELHPDIFVCEDPRLPWPEFWKRYQNFG